jgi:acetolactate synthase-1/2/3 large subunit
MSEQKMTGGEALVKCLERLGVEYVWGYSGGAALPIFDALVDSPIKLILVRHEQGASHMADGYARATGKPGVVLVTSGPGATNTLTGILTAHMDSVPMIVLTGQTISPMLGKDAFQEADVFDITMPVVKHSYLVKETNEIPRVVKEAFHITSTGRPGPVLIDLPKDMTSGDFTGDLDPEMDLPGYKAEPETADTPAILDAAEALSKAKRPLILAGHGALIAGAEAELLALAEKLRAPVTTTLLGKGVFPETHELSLGMLGMHGTAYANKAVVNCDLILSVGSRFDDRIIGKADKFCTDAKRIHIDIDASEFGRMIPCDIYCHGDARAALAQLTEQVKRGETDEWLATIEGYKSRYPLTFKKRGGLKMQQILQELWERTEGKAIVATDVGQHQMWAAQFYRSVRSHNWLSSGGAGTMGFGLPAAIGAQVGRPGEPVWAIVGDGGFQMTLCELATACIHKLPIKVIVMNNSYLGMVRQWQTLFYDDRKYGVDLEGNPDFAKLAQAYEGALGLTLKRAADIGKILDRAEAHTAGPVVINALVEKTDNVFPMIPAGATLDEMLITEPKGVKLEKPTGST